MKDVCIRRLRYQALCFFVLLSGMSLQAGSYHNNSLNVRNGIFMPTGFDTGYALEIGYTRYFANWTYFIEISGGVSSLNLSSNQLSGTLNPLAGNNADRIYTYEVLLGLDVSPLRGLPHLVIGAAGMDQIEVVQFAYVAGIGKQVPLVMFSKKLSRLGLRYDLRDYIMTEKIVANTGEAPRDVVTHNLMMSLGVILYF